MPGVAVAPKVGAVEVVAPNPGVAVAPKPDVAVAPKPVLGAPKAGVVVAPKAGVVVAPNAGVVVAPKESGAAEVAVLPKSPVEDAAGAARPKLGAVAGLKSM